ncbi:MAG: domain S-box protein, partial [Frankiales bacterium]|nr:domain S-box protein [Frankiales bacterium]
MPDADLDLPTVRRGRGLRAWAWLCVLLGLVLAAGWGISSAEQQTRSSVRDRFETRQATAAVFIQEIVAEVLRRQTVLAERTLRGPVDQVDLAAAAALTGWQDALLLDSEGRLLASFPKADGLGTKVLAGVPNIEAALAGAPGVSGVVSSLAHGEPVLGFAVPFETPTGRRVLASGFPVAATPLEPYVRDAVALTRHVYLVDDSGQVVASKEPAGAGLGRLSAVNPGVASVVAAHRSGVADVAGVPMFVTSTAVAKTPWRLVMATPTSDLYRALNGPARWAPWVGLGAFIVAALAAFGLHLRVSAQAQRVAAGKARLRGILDTTVDAFVAADDQGRITDWNAAATTLLGWTPGEILGRSLAATIVPARDHERLASFFDPRTALAGALELSALHRDGHEVVVELTQGRMQWAGTWRHHAFLRDITERRAAAEALAQSEALYRLLAAHSRDVICRVAPDGRFTYVSPGCRHLLGLEPEDLLGVSLYDRIHPGDTAVTDGARLRLLASGEAEERTVRMRHANGHWVWVEAVASLVHAPDGAVAEIQASLRDISERMQTAEQLHRQALVFNSIHDAVLILDNDGQVLDCNQAALSLTGRRKSDLVGQPTDVLWGQTSQVARSQDAPGQLAEHAVWSGDLPFVRADATSGIAETTAISLHNPAGEATGTITVSRDVTQARRDEEARREGEEQFRLAFDRAPVGMVLSGLQPDNDGRLLRVNPALGEMLGFSQQELLQRTLLDLTHPDDREADAERLAQWITRDQDALTFEKRLLHADGHVVYALLTAGVVRAADGSPRHTVTQLLDISERRAEAERMAALALQDPLTGLANRALLNDRLAHAVDRAQRQQRPLSLLFCDLDRFKAVNDTYGHAIGDALLVQAAQRIRAVVRPGDTVARMGGDEFVVICEDLGDDSGEVIAARMRAALEQPFRLSVGQVRIGASIGVATAAAEDLSVEGLLALADERMYAEKHAVARAPEDDRPLVRSAPELSGLAGGQVERILELARRHLDMDAVHLSQFTDGQQVHRAVGGDAGSFGLIAGSANAREASYCHRMVRGEIPQVIPDTAADEGVRDLPVTTAAGLGAYIGVPLRLSDGTVYGTFCCLSHNERPDLDSRDLGFMQMLAALLVDDLDEQHTAQQRRQALTDIVRAERVTMALQPIVDLRTGRCAGLEALARFPAPAGPP